MLLALLPWDKQLLLVRVSLTGRMVVQKGPDLLLEAVPFIHKFRGDAKFVFVGDGHMMESLKGRAAQLGVTHSGTFTFPPADVDFATLSCSPVVPADSH